MNIYTIGFTQKPAKLFFEIIKKNNINIIVDIRLNNRSQLAGFTKSDDFAYFLDEICECNYIHCPEYAPTKDILDEYKKKIITWSKYEEQYNLLMERRNVIDDFNNRFSGIGNLCLLCSEATPENCHRRLFAEIISTSNLNLKIKHL